MINRHIVEIDGRRFDHKWKFSGKLMEKILMIN